MNKKAIDKHFLPLEKKAISKFLKEIRKKEPHLLSLILFGSKARKESTPDSDIDLVALVKKRRAKDLLYKEVASVLSKFGVYLSVKPFTKKEFEKLSQLKTPFMENIKKEGVVLWQKQ